MKIKTFGAVLASALMLGTFYVSASAEELIIAEDDVIVIDDLSDYPTNDELLMGYFEQELYGGKKLPEIDYDGNHAYFGVTSEDVMYAAIASDALGDGGMSMYDALSGTITDIAGGDVTSAQIVIPSTVVSFEELGLSGSPSNDKIKTALKDLFGDVYRTLLVDFPYEMYWHDKTSGTSWGYSLSVGSDSVNIIDFTIRFRVALEYQGADEYTTDAEKTKAAAASAENAKEIVAKHADKDDIGKLTAYRDEIHSLVTYDHDAADSSPSVIGIDPWQLIHVFDGDTETNVVCEGYSKAFEHLCNLSTFSGNVKCYNVGGEMNGGAHMWNIVTIGKRNYLVDVTNTDEGTIGAPDQLFLKGVSGSVSLGYTRTIGSSSIKFTYGDDEKKLYPVSVLTLSSVDYSADLKDDDVVISDTGIVVWANGAKVKQEDGSSVDYKSTVVETTLEATGWNNPATNKSQKGKLVWTSLLTGDEPVFNTEKHKVDTKSDKTVVSVSKGKITAKSGGEDGEATAFVFASDTGTMTSEGFKVTVKNAASSILLFDDAEKTDKKDAFKKTTLVAGDSAIKVYVTPSAKQGAVSDDCTYTITAKKNEAGVVEFSKLKTDANGRMYFELKGLKTEKSGKASKVSVTVTCDQSNKKASLNVTVTAPVTKVTAASEDTLKAKGDIAKLDFAYTVTGGELTSDKLQFIVAESDPTLSTDGKKVTFAKSKAVAVKLEKDGKTVTLKASQDITAAQNVYVIVTDAATKEKKVYKLCTIGTDGTIK